MSRVESAFVPPIHRCIYIGAGRPYWEKEEARARLCILDSFFFFFFFCFFPPAISHLAKRAWDFSFFFFRVERDDVLLARNFDASPIVDRFLLANRIKVFDVARSRAGQKKIKQVECNWKRRNKQTVRVVFFYFLLFLFSPGGWPI